VYETYEFDPWNLYLINLDSYVQSRFLQIHSCMSQNLVLKATYLRYSIVMKQIIVLLVDPSQNFIFVPLLTTKLETLAPSWAIFDALASTWEKWVVSIAFRRYGFLLLFLILMLLFPQQLYYLLRINHASHYSTLLFLLPFLQSFSLLVIIKLRH
jgi:hypothetical protein